MICGQIVTSDVWQDLFKLSPLIAFLLIVILALTWYVLRKDKELKEQQEYTRKSDKENLDLLLTLNSTLDSLSNGHANTLTNVTKDIAALKEFISMKIDELKRNNGNH